MKKCSMTFATLLLISICVTMTACQNKVINIVSDDCEAPCWRQIKPGVSTDDEVIELLDGFHDITSDEIWQGGGSESSEKAIAFELSNGVNVTIYSVDKVVVLILFSKTDGITSFRDCIQEFGDPEYTVQSSVIGFGLPLGATSAWHTWFYALNTKNGTAYGYDTYSYFGKKAAITPKTKVTVIEFYDTTSFETLLSKGLLVNKEISKDIPIEALHPWVGFGNIDELYPEK